MGNAKLSEIKDSLLSDSKETLDATTEKIKDYEFYKTVINVVVVVIIALQTVAAAIVFINTVTSTSSSSSSAKSNTTSPFTTIAKESSDTVNLSLLFTILIIIIAYIAWIGILLIIRTITVSLCDHVIEKCRRNKAEGYRDIISLTERQMIATGENGDKSQESAPDNTKLRYRIIPGTIRCRTCGALNPDDAEKCERCGDILNTGAI